MKIPKSELKKYGELIPHNADGNSWYRVKIEDVLDIISTFKKYDPRFGGTFFLDLDRLSSGKITHAMVYVCSSEIDFQR